MARLTALVACVCVALGVSLAAPAADADAASKKRVCFTKTVKVKGKKAVKRKVCRAPKRRRTVKAAPVTGAPLPVAAPAPVAPPAPGPAPVTATPVAPTPAPAPAAPACVPEDTEWLTVTALDALESGFRFRFSRLCFRAGRLIVQLRNEDSQEHNLWAEGVTPAVARRKVSVVPARVGEQVPIVQEETNLSAGTWRFLCTIPGHEAMTKTVTVVP